MKIFCWVCILLLFLANGCSSMAPKELTSRNNSESFCLVLVPPPQVEVIRLPVKIDNYNAKLKFGSFLELELSPGMHSFFVRPGYFPPASTNVSGRAGERRYFLYVMQYGWGEIQIFTSTGTSDVSVIKPVQAAWKEITQEEFESLFPHAKFNH